VNPSALLDAKQIPARQYRIGLHLTRDRWRKSVLPVQQFSIRPGARLCLKDQSAVLLHYHKRFYVRTRCG
jgi:hypothetical protein